MHYACRHQGRLLVQPPLGTPTTPACCWTALSRISTTRLHGYRRTPVSHSLPVHYKKTNKTKFIYSCSACRPAIGSFCRSQGHASRERAVQQHAGAFGSRVFVQAKILVLAHTAHFKIVFQLMTLWTSNRPLVLPA